MGKSRAIAPHSAALKGFAFALPFMIVNFIVALRLEPLYSFLASFPAIRNSAFLPLALLLLFPVGAFISLRPVLQKGNKKIYPVNLILAIILIAVFMCLFFSLGEELYRCNILRIPNCD